MILTFWYVHKTLGAGLNIAAPNEQEANRILNLITAEGDEDSWKLADIIDEHGNPVEMDADGNYVFVEMPVATS